MNKYIREQFPIFLQKIDGKPLIYFDNAATSQKPQVVIDAIADFYRYHNAPVYRGVYQLAEHATERYEAARSRIAQFINAQDSTEIVFTRGATHGINIIASIAQSVWLQPGDEIVLTELEHHSNMLAWQWVAQQTGACIRYIPVDYQGNLLYNQLDAIISSKTKIVACTAYSNAIGTWVDIPQVVAAARKHNAYVLIDASQLVPHRLVDVSTLDIDCMVFSGHKMCGPTGIGVLYVRESLHDKLVPFERGGGMVYQAGYYDASYARMPRLLEAGSPPVAQAIGLHAAIDFLSPYMVDTQLSAHESVLTQRCINGLQSMDDVTIIGPVNDLCSGGHQVSFIIDGMHAHDIASYLDGYAVCVRAGHHCAQPLAHKLGIDAMVRVSFYLYNTIEEVDYMIELIRNMPRL